MTPDIYENARRDGAIEECIEVLVSRWERWSAEAGQAAQQEQSEEAYIETMKELVKPILAALVRVVMRSER